MIITLLCLLLVFAFFYLGVVLQAKVISDRRLHYLIVSQKDSIKPRTEKVTPLKNKYGYIHVQWNLWGRALIVNLRFIRNVLYQACLLSFVVFYDRIDGLYWIEFMSGVAAASGLLWYYTVEQMPRRCKIAFRPINSL